MRALQVIDQSLSLGDLTAYIQKVNEIPMLTLEEERQLAERWHVHQDLDAARRLTLAHLRFVVRVARGYMGYGLPLADLIQEGNIGLMKAVKRFDPSVGVRLVSFAVHWVKAELHEFIIRNWRIVKVATTKAQRKLFFNLRNSKKRLGWFSREEVEGVAQDLGVNPSDVLEMEARLNARDAAFDGYADDGDDDGSHSAGFAPAHYLEDKRMDPALQLEHLDTAQQGQSHLYAAMEQLDERSRDIVMARWLGEKRVTLHELAKRYNISAERVRQLEQRAMQKLRADLQQNVATTR